jgi:hypothetical protein
MSRVQSAPRSSRRASSCLRKSVVRVRLPFITHSYLIAWESCSRLVSGRRAPGHFDQGAGNGAIKGQQPGLPILQRGNVRLNRRDVAARDRARGAASDSHRQDILGRTAAKRRERVERITPVNTGNDKDCDCAIKQRGYAIARRAAPA